MSVLKETPNALFQASADAAKASDYLLEKYQYSLQVHQKKEKDSMEESKKVAPKSYMYKYRKKQEEVDLEEDEELER